MGLIVISVPGRLAMMMSNFISEAERHEELYSSYSERHQEVLLKFNNINSMRSSDVNVLNVLLENGVTCSEIEWLKRTGHYLPSH